jgi:EAL domain-containing protein (putative c-di-GMP-specific phosphodiesterase class I)
MPIDQLKINGALLSNLQKQPQNQVVIRAIIAIADSMGMTPIAKDVDTAEQLAMVTGLGCPAVQGPLFAPPANATEVTHWLSRWQDRRRHSRDLDLLRHG